MSNSQNSKLALAWVGIVGVLAVTGWFGWKALQESKPETPSGGPGGGRPPATVIVRPAEEREVVEHLSATGTLQAVRRAEVAARESAAVDAILVDEGDTVAAGDVLARLDDRRLEAQLQEGRAALTAIKAELSQRLAEHERAILDEKMMSELWDERAVSEREFLDSARELKVAAARAEAADEAIAASAKRLELLEVRRTDLDIKAPFDGRVVARHTELGEWVSEGDPVVTLLSTGEVEAWIKIPERHIESLRAATPDTIELHLPGRAASISADKISLIPDVEGRSRLFNLIAHIPDPENQLTPGSSVEAIVPLGKPAPRLVISSDAVLQSFSGSYVFVPMPAGDGPPISKRFPVEILFERLGEAIVTSELLKPGDDVIVEGNERLFPGTPLDPKPWHETHAKGAVDAH